MKNNLKFYDEKIMNTIIKICIILMSLGFSVCSMLLFGNAYKCILDFSIDRAFDFGFYMVFGLTMFVACIAGLFCAVCDNDKYSENTPMY